MGKSTTILTILAIGILTTAVAKDSGVGDSCGFISPCPGIVFCSRLDGTCGGTGAVCVTDDQCVGSCYALVCGPPAGLGFPGMTSPTSNSTHAWNNGTASANCTGKPSMPATQTNTTLLSTPPPRATATPAASIVPATGAASMARTHYGLATICAMAGILAWSV